MMTASPFAPARAARQLYRETAINSQTDRSVDSHHLVCMLFDGFFEAVAQGRGAIRSGDIVIKCKSLTRAVAIVEEGLRAALDVNQGGSLARDLRDLYAYVTLRLTRANLTNDEAALDECIELMQPLAEAWASIRPNGTSAAVANGG